MGSIQDVKECKGDAAYLTMEKYLDDNSLPFVNFSSSVNSWMCHSSINIIHNKYF